MQKNVAAEWVVVPKHCCAADFVFAAVNAGAGTSAVPVAAAGGAGTGAAAGAGTAAVAGTGDAAGHRCTCALEDRGL